MPVMGITRLANLTGLDVLGIPVAAAVRPNSRSLAVHQGKGLTLAAAKISALMEAAEAHHAEFIDAPLRWGRRRDLPVPTVDPARLPRMPGSGDPEEERCLWIEGRDLMTDAPCWVPHELVHADYTAPQPAGSGLFQATTNGLAAGASPEAAMAHGLCEAIERDAMALWYDAGAALGPAARVVDLASGPSGPLTDLVRRIEAAGASVAAWDVTSDIGLPAFACIIAAPDDDPLGVETELGAACHTDPATALLRALLEAAQTRITRISGARDDFGTDS
jgi:ribosomal protein S12 methylthiotransferase accessory factor